MQRIIRPAAATARSSAEGGEDALPCLCIFRDRRRARKISDWNSISEQRPEDLIQFSEVIGAVIGSRI